MKYSLVRVSGPSMQPTYYEGDLLLVKNITPKCIENYMFDTDGVYVFQSPEFKQTEHLLIKRLYSIGLIKVGLYFLGDNSECSRDSRHFGYVPKENLRAKVIRCVHKNRKVRRK